MFLPVERADAQTNEESGPPDPQRLQAVLEQIAPDQRLRLEAGTPGLRLEGRYAGTADARLALVTDGGVVHARLGEIDRLWTRGRSTAKGALIGGVGGLVIGATYGALISGVTCAESSCTTLGLAAAELPCFIENQHMAVRDSLPAARDEAGDSMRHDVRLASQFRSGR